MIKNKKFLLVGNITYQLYHVSTCRSDCFKFLQRNYSSGELPEPMWIRECPYSWSLNRIHQYLTESKRCQDELTERLSN